MTTNLSRDDHEAERKKQGIAHQMAPFLERYRPADRNARFEFERDLTYLVQTIYQEAQAPVLKTLQDAASVGFLNAPPFARELVEEKDR